MKIIIQASLVFFALFIFSSCKKDSSTSGGGGNTATGTKLVRIQQGTDPTTDTVFKIIYSGNNIAKIYDSIYAGVVEPDTLSTTYVNGTLVSASDQEGFSANYSYNGSGQISTIDAMVAGEHDVYTYTYNSGVLAQKTWSSDFGQGGSPTLYETFKYTMTNGNITEWKQYDNGNNLLVDLTLTYSSQAQPAAFKQLGLLNIGNLLGLDNILGFDAYSFDGFLNTNLVTGCSEGGVSATFTNTFNAQQLPVKIVTNIPETFSGFTVDLSTWFFAYN
jgi:hypothetical protein